MVPIDTPLGKELLALKETNKQILLLTIFFGVILTIIGCAGTYKAQVAERRQNYVEMVDRPKHIEDAILAGEVAIGMSEADVSASWGFPSERSRSITKYGVSEVWIYKYLDCGYYACIWVPLAYVHFEDGVVTAINKY